MSITETATARSIERASSTGDITVAVLLHGEPPEIERLVDTVRGQGYDGGRVEILCLDDGSSPRARALLETLQVRLIDVPDGCSISEAKNLALRLCSDEFVFFLDDHINLEPGGLGAAMRRLSADPQLAGVCGFYRSSRDSDFNLYRDIKRHSIYGKADVAREISLDYFTTFSTGIAVLRKASFLSSDFPEGDFPRDFGGEDVPVLLAALHRGMRFAYEPALHGHHGHDLSLTMFLRKVEIEVRGRFSLLYWASNHPEIEIPYLHGFLSAPYLLFLSLVGALLATAAGMPKALLIPVVLFCAELAFSLRCLNSPIRYRLRDRLGAASYVLASEILSALCFVQYLVCSYKRPYRSLGLRKFLAVQRIFLRWESIKYTRWLTSRLRG